MKSDQIRDLSIEEVEHRLHEVSEELFNLNLRKRVHKLDNPLRLRVLRRERARIMTIVNEHEKGIRRISASAKLLGGDKVESGDKE